MPFAPVGTPAPPSRALPRMAIALLACLALYGIDLACMATVPATGFDFASGFAVPFDLMVFVPAVFYLLVVRRYRLSPLLVLPVIWLGAVGVELGIAAREVLRLVRRFRTAKASSDNPLDWFSDAFSALARNERVARMAALECVMWYYASASWRRAPHVPHGYRAFSSHRQSGYVAAVGVMLVLIAVETVAAHLLAARFSVAAACVLTALSLYTILWMIAEARAVVLNPLLVDDVELVARWGMLVCERIPLDRIARVGSQDPAVPKRELLNLAAMGGQALWIELAEPLEVRGLTGKPRLVRAIKTTPDDAAAFKDALRPRS